LVFSNQKRDALPFCDNMGGEAMNTGEDGQSCHQTNGFVGFWSGLDFTQIGIWCLSEIWGSRVGPENLRA